MFSCISERQAVYSSYFSISSLTPSAATYYPPSLPPKHLTTFFSFFFFFLNLLPAASMALLDPYSYDLGSIFDIPTNFIPDLSFDPEEEEDHLFHRDDFNLLPPDFHYFDSDLYSHHQQLPPDTDLNYYEDSTFFPPLPFYLPQHQLHHDYLFFDEPPPKRHKSSSHYPPFDPNYPNTLTAPDIIHTFYHTKDKKESPTGGRQQRRPTAQSIAARERRKRISDKTQELARLLPGGAAKMNTADMLQNAFTYVNFLQAQVHLLQLMDSSFHNNNLQVLSSTAVQEKLYTNHKCLLPLDFVIHLAQELPQLAKELTQFVTVHSTL